MAKNVRISDELYALACAEACLQDRSIAQQLEHWAKRGMAAAGRPGADTVSALDAAMAMTRRLDAQAVRDGRRSPESLHFIPRWMVREAVIDFPSRRKK